MLISINGLYELIASRIRSIGTVDVCGGRYAPVAELPVFTRGLDFCGDFGLHWLVAGSRVCRFQRHPPNGAADRADVRRLGGGPYHGADGCLPEIRGRSTGNLRRSGPARCTAFPT